VRRFDPDRVQNGHILFFYKRGGSIHILGVLRHFLWVRLRILVINEMSLEVWNSSWVSSIQMQQDIFIFSYKGNLILLFFTRSKFNWIRGHESLLLLRFETVQTFTIVGAGNDCFVLVACKYNKIFLFFSYKG